MMSEKYGFWWQVSGSDFEYRQIQKKKKKLIVSILKLSYSIGKQFCLVQAFISRKKQEKFKPEINK